MMAGPQYEGGVLLTPAEQQQAGLTPPSGPLGDIATGGAAVGIRGLLGGNKPFSEMTPQERAAAQSPLSLAEAGRLVLPFLVNRLVPAGRTMTRVGGQLLGNIVGSGALEAGQESVKGGSPLQGFVSGAMKGIPGGIAQGGLGALLGPNKATIQAQAATQMARMRGVFSPRVQATIPQDPKAIFSGETIKAMVKAAGNNLDEMESSIRGTLGGAQGKKNLQAKFDYLRERIKTLRDVGDQPRTTPELRGAAKKAAAEAQRLEQELVATLKKEGFPAEAQRYLGTIRQYATDRARIRVLKAIQRTQALPGGINRADNPEMAELTDALQSSELGPAARATFMTTLVALRHPFMALHFARSGMGKGFIDPQKVKVPRFGEFAGPLSAGGGAAASLTTREKRSDE